MKRPLLGGNTHHRCFQMDRFLTTPQRGHIGWFRRHMGAGNWWSQASHTLGGFCAGIDRMCTGRQASYGANCIWLCKDTAADVPSLYHDQLWYRLPRPLTSEPADLFTAIHACFTGDKSPRFFWRHLRHTTAAQHPPTCQRPCMDHLCHIHTSTQVRRHTALHNHPYTSNKHPPTKWHICSLPLHGDESKTALQAGQSFRASSRLTAWLRKQVGCSASIWGSYKHCNSAASQRPWHQEAAAQVAVFEGNGCVVQIASLRKKDAIGSTARKHLAGGKTSLRLRFWYLPIYSCWGCVATATSDRLLVLALLNPLANESWNW